MTCFSWGQPTVETQNAISPHGVKDASSDTSESSDVSAKSSRSRSGVCELITGGVLCDRNGGVPSIGTDSEIESGDCGVSIFSSSISWQRGEVGVGGT